MTAESPEAGHGTDGTEDTIIGFRADDSRPPALIVPGEPALRQREVNNAEAPTILVSRAGSRQVDAALAAFAAPVPAPVPPSASERPPEPDPRGANYAIRIGAHAPIPLDVPTYVGRRPSTPRITGLHMPRLVMVPSPLNEVSSTHVELLQQADTVVVTDLGSTNGTTVTVPGYPPRSLRQGESLVVGQGTVVDIGDGVRIVVVTFPDPATMEGTQ